jgi:hypothetical protein
MQSWVGKKESDGSFKSIIDLYNNEKPLAVGYAVKYTDAWCDTTVSAAAIKAVIPREIFPRECGCGRHIELFKNINSWVEDDAYVPLPGDVIFYDWEDNGVGDNVGTADHVGIIEKCDGKTIIVIEGNKSNSVERRTLAVNGRYIRGYGVPKYPAQPIVAVPTEGEKAIAELVKLGRITSPDVWTKLVDGRDNDDVKNLEYVFIKWLADARRADGVK